MSKRKTILDTYMAKALKDQPKEVLVVNILKHFEMLLLAYKKLKSLGVLEEYLSEMSPENKGLADTLMQIYEMADMDNEK